MVSGAIVATAPAASAASAQVNWSNPIDIDPGNTLSAVSCASETFCAAVDYRGNVVMFDGTRWSHPILLQVPFADQQLYGGLQEITAVSCPTADFCAAVDVQGNAFTYDGISWSGPTLVDPPPTNCCSPISILYSVSCPTATFCVAVGDGGGINGGNAFMYDGTNWSTMSTGEALPETVSCTSATFCMGIGSGVSASIYNGTSWSLESDNIDPTQTEASYPSPISCVSPTHCTAVDGLDIVTYDGTSWSAPIEAAPPIYAGIIVENVITSISCPEVSFCAAVGYNDAVTYDGTRWSVPLDIIPQIANNNALLKSVSCPDASFCVAVDPPGGDAFIYSTAKALKLVNAPLQSGQPQAPYSATLAAIGGTLPYKWSISSGHLPKGLHLGKSTGVISGTPKKTDSGTYRFTVRIVDRKIKVKHQPTTQNTATEALSITIS